MALRGLASITFPYMSLPNDFHLHPSVPQRTNLSLSGDSIFPLLWSRRGVVAISFCQFSVISILINAGFVDGIDLKESDKSLVSNILRFGMDKLTFFVSRPL